MESDPLISPVFVLTFRAPICNSDNAPHCHRPVQDTEGTTIPLYTMEEPSVEKSTPQSS